MTLTDSTSVFKIQAIKYKVPSNCFQPTSPRSWLVNPLRLNPWWLIFLSMLPAMFFSILIAMDQNITSVIVNRKDNKIQKGYGYHLDLAVIALLMIMCSSFGIPFYVAATVVSLMHVHSLRLMSETAAPGEKPEFLGIREQRVTALTAHVFVALSLFITPVMKLIPVPVLLGIFLYMGIVSLHGQQFIDRLLIIFMPTKYQPDEPWLRKVRIKRVHLFTLIQLAAFIGLTVVEEIKMISMAFPLMLMVMVCIRKFVMEKIFLEKELRALDDPLPPWHEMIRPSNKPLMPTIDSDKTKKNEQTVELISRSFDC
ncbi:unnamed protein product [Soboliphyme baturini]|uniref:Bicarbonate transporter-like transmembrane domain-containing protein n=1 Tax=Soboliphyme baturini TaxID=241478 RepID=A0A3P8ATF5_9BILA|nr:unnamed protein product [Soboliphyme baturini]